MGITMKDLARRAGVSESTVSRALNNKAGVGPITRERIQKLALQYGFTPNPLARGLARKTTGMVGLILPDIDNYYTGAVVRGIENTCNNKGYHVVLGNSDGQVHREASYISFFTSSQVDGIIFLSGGLAEEAILKLGLKGYPLLLINRFIEELSLPTLFLDHQHGAYLATQHLLKGGETRIALILGSLEHMEQEERLLGYEEALRAHGQPYEENLVLETDGSRQGGYDAFLRLLEQTTPPQAIFAAGDLLALGVVEAIKTGGYMIPQDFAVVGFEDNLITSLIHPPLTTVALPYYDLGCRAAEKIIGAINKEEQEETVEILKPHLIHRSTSPKIKI